MDTYFEGALLDSDPALASALEASTAAGLPAINVSPLQGKFLMQLAQAANAKHILEVGTLAGYSTLWFARASPDTQIVTLELDAKHAAVARSNFEHAGVAHRISLEEGDAHATLPLLLRAAEGDRPFDLTFIDADKPSSLDYFVAALQLTRPRGLIIVDNVVRKGAVADAASTDASVKGVQRLVRFLASEEGRAAASCSALQTVGCKGHDGFLMATVLR